MDDEEESNNFWEARPGIIEDSDDEQGKKLDELEQNIENSDNNKLSQKDCDGFNLNQSNMNHQNHEKNDINMHNFSNQIFPNIPKPDKAEIFTGDFNNNLNQNIPENEFKNINMNNYNNFNNNNININNMIINNAYNINPVLDDTEDLKDNENNEGNNLIKENEPSLERSLSSNASNDFRLLESGKSNKLNNNQISPINPIPIRIPTHGNQKDNFSISNEQNKNNTKNFIENKDKNQEQINIIGNINDNNQHQIQVPNPSFENSQLGGYSFSRYKKAAKTGLKLIDNNNTSYLNSVLQILGNIRNLASYFLNPKNNKYIEGNHNKMKLSFVIYRLFTHLYPNIEKIESEKYTPYYVQQVISNYNIVYNNKDSGNPNDLIFFILECLHNELNQNKNKNNLLKPNNYDKNNVIICGIKNFQNLNDSVIYNNLYWFKIEESKCTKCSQSSYKLLPFPLFELGILDTYNQTRKTLTIHDCLKLYEYPKKIKIFCQICKKYTEKKNFQKIFCAPYTFIFSLDRKNLDPNLMQIPFDIEDKINIRNFVEAKDRSPYQYQLIGIVSFFITQNKYISCCMSPVDKQWYIYNDENVQQIELKNILDLHNCQNSQYVPCILAYKSYKSINY